MHALRRLLHPLAHRLHRCTVDPGARGKGGLRCPVPRLGGYGLGLERESPRLETRPGRTAREGAGGAVPDADKGEKLVAVTNQPALQLAEVRAAITAAGMTNLCTPRDLRVLEELPKLGTGKLNHREVLQFVNPNPA